jgi:hypothetical protein
MSRRRWSTAVLLAVSILGFAKPATAGPLDWLLPDDRGCGCYSPARYWFPGLAHCHDNKVGPKLPVCPPNRHPEIPPYCFVLKYPCPTATPAQTLIPVPAPHR